jgi:hypothetical protein
MILQAWHDFFILAGTAAAQLLGLIFVAASIAATIPNEKLGEDGSRSLWVLPIVYAFLRVLVISALGVTPGLTPRSFGYVLLVLAVLDLGRMIWAARAMRHAQNPGKRLTTSHWTLYFVCPSLATLAVAGAGVALAVGYYLPFPLLAVGLVGHLVIGVHNAWELVAWLATRQ